MASRVSCSTGVTPGSDVEMRRKLWNMSRRPLMVDYLRVGAARRICWTALGVRPSKNAQEIWPGAIISL